MVSVNASHWLVANNFCTELEMKFTLVSGGDGSGRFEYSQDRTERYRNAIWAMNFDQQHIQSS